MKYWLIYSPIFNLKHASAACFLVGNTNGLSASDLLKKFQEILHPNPPKRKKDKQTLSQWRQQNEEFLQNTEQKGSLANLAIVLLREEMVLEKVRH